ncbi:MAG: hypothetical protein R2748_22655 [Bryobacterales bacterium]
MKRLFAAGLLLLALSAVGLIVGMIATHNRLAVVGTDATPHQAESFVAP